MAMAAPVLATLLCILLLLPPCTESKSSPWPMFGHDSQHTGQSAFAGPSGRAVAPAWTFSALDSIQAPPCLSSTLLYVGSDDTTFYALNSTTGAPVWAANTTRRIRSAPALLPGVGAVVVCGEDGAVHAFDAASGAPRWTFATPLAIHASPVVASDGALYIGGQDGVVHRVFNGVAVWSAARVNSDVFSPALSPDESVLYVSYDISALVAYNASSGAVLWMVERPGGFQSPPTVGFGLVFASAREVVYALNASTGAAVWSFNTDMWIRDLALGPDGTLYVSSRDSHVYALRWDTGALKWKLLVPSKDLPCPLALGSDGTLYVGTGVGVTAIATSPTAGGGGGGGAGTILWSYRGERVTSTVVSAGTVYATVDSGDVLALVDASSPSPTPSLPPSVTGTPSATPSFPPTPSPTGAASAPSGATATASMPPSSPPAAGPGGAAGAAGSASLGVLAGAAGVGALLGAAATLGLTLLCIKLRRPTLRLQELLFEPLLASHRPPPKGESAAARQALYSRLEDALPLTPFAASDSSSKRGAPP
jgi:outer membrane protein assembly factor BamB